MQSFRELTLSIRKMFSNDETLSNKATKGIILMSVRQFILQSLLLIKILVVAKILGPTIYGTFGLVLIIVLFIDQFTQLGFELELIHKPESKYQYNTAWSLKVIRGLALFLVIQLFDDYILTIVGSGANYTILTSISLILLIEGFVNIGTIEFSKELNYNKEFLFRAIPDVLNILFTILFLFLMQDIWALIFGLLAERISRLLLSYILHSFRPKFELKTNVFSELFNFGKWILLMGVLSFFRLQGSDLFIGAILGASFVAIYQLSFKLVTTPVTAMSELIGGVSIPTYAKLQGNQESSVKTFYITILGQFLVFNLYFSLFWPVLPLFVNELLGSEWMHMIEIMRILFFIGYLFLFIASIEPIFVANGIQKKLVRWQIIVMLIFILVVSPITSNYELIGITLLNLVTTSILTGCYLFELSKIIEIPIREIVIDAIHIIGNGLITIFSVYGILQLINFHPFVKVCIGLGFGFIAYIVVTFVSNKVRRILIIHELRYLLDQLLVRD